MDIQRQAFEEVYKQTEIYKREVAIRKTDILFFSEKFGYFNIVTHDAWLMWQAANAVPEGFVLVIQKELLELVIAINVVDLATHTEGKPNEVREMWQQVALKLGALFSTGASHD